MAPTHDTTSHTRPTAVVTQIPAEPARINSSDTAFEIAWLRELPQTLEDWIGSLRRILHRRQLRDAMRRHPAGKGLR